MKECDSTKVLPCVRVDQECSVLFITAMSLNASAVISNSSGPEGFGIPLELTSFKGRFGQTALLQTDVFSVLDIPGGTKPLKSLPARRI